MSAPTQEPPKGVDETNPVSFVNPAAKAVVDPYNVEQDEYELTLPTGARVKINPNDGSFETVEGAGPLEANPPAVSIEYMPSGTFGGSRTVDNVDNPESHVEGQLPGESTVQHAAARPDEYPAGVDPAPMGPVSYDPQEAARAAEVVREGDEPGDPTAIEGVEAPEPEEKTTAPGATPSEAAKDDQEGAGAPAAEEEDEPAKDAKQAEAAPKKRAARSQPNDEPQAEEK